MLHLHSVFITRLHPYSCHLLALLWRPYPWKVHQAQPQSSVFNVFGEVFLVRMQTKVWAWGLVCRGAESPVILNVLPQDTVLICSSICLCYISKIQSAQAFREQQLSFHSIPIQHQTHSDLLPRITVTKIVSLAIQQNLTRRFVYKQNAWN